MACSIKGECQGKYFSLDRSMLLLNSTRQSQ
jgi:hypothetical protein